MDDSYKELNSLSLPLSVSLSVSLSLPFSLSDQTKEMSNSSGFCLEGCTSRICAVYELCLCCAENGPTTIRICSCFWFCLCLSVCLSVFLSVRHTFFFWKEKKTLSLTAFLVMCLQASYFSHHTIEFCLHFLHLTILTFSSWLPLVLSFPILLSVDRSIAEENVHQRLHAWTCFWTTSTGGWFNERCMCPCGSRVVSSPASDGSHTRTFSLCFSVFPSISVSFFFFLSCSFLPLF